MRIQTDRYNDKVVEQVLKVYEEERGSIMQDESRDQAQKKRDWLERSGCFVFIEQQPQSGEDHSEIGGAQERQDPRSERGQNGDGVDQLPAPAKTALREASQGADRGDETKIYSFDIETEQQDVFYHNRKIAKSNLKVFENTIQTPNLAKQAEFAQI
eukprot:CAMPEP_0168607436 /NCGR_PEP_ID=MMETSP0449_2-20121227/40_1 /TAXON_ID=1082188 /ORGANISM="Strombidium rassoulzadegani, Strain ras09" /LENGTH=156 /DNA_ID=CAMNT_0008647249 /DNA_START=134 /DNA_END=604 /DNA_ORIENTATION=-